MKLSGYWKAILAAVGAAVAQEVVQNGRQMDDWQTWVIVAATALVVAFGPANKPRQR